MDFDRDAVVGIEMPTKSDTQTELLVLIVYCSRKLTKVVHMIMKYTEHISNNRDRGDHTYTIQSQKARTK